MKKILSIDGGGIRGIIPATMLMKIENLTYKITANLFDMIAGTSTGGILAALLCFPKSAYYAHRLYFHHGGEIFRKSFWSKFRSVFGLMEEKYDCNILEKLLKDYLTDISVLGAASTKLLITAYDIERRKPFLFKSWQKDEKMIAMWEAARATSAAPTYFEPYLMKAKGGNKFALIDGGVYANNPAMCAYAEAKRLWPEEDILILSLGTGEATKPIKYKEAKNWGLVEWARPILDVVFDGMSDAVNYQLEQILGKRRYFRLQGKLNSANDDMDDASPANVQNLQRDAYQISSNERYKIDEFLQVLGES